MCGNLNNILAIHVTYHQRENDTYTLQKIPLEKSLDNIVRVKVFTWTVPWIQVSGPQCYSHLQQPSLDFFPWPVIELVLLSHKKKKFSWILVVFDKKFCRTKHWAKLWMIEPHFGTRLAIITNWRVDEGLIWDWHSIRAHATLVMAGVLQVGVVNHILHLRIVNCNQYKYVRTWIPCWWDLQAPHVFSSCWSNSWDKGMLHDVFKCPFVACTCVTITENAINMHICAYTHSNRFTCYWGYLYRKSSSIGSPSSVTSSCSKSKHT